MTEVAFHFNAPDQQAYACRLLRKGYLKGARLVVRAEAHALASLDAALWTFAAGEFIPHARQGDAPYVLERSPVQIYSELPDVLENARSCVLVNLCFSMPPGFERFARVIEVVTFDENDRQQARERWRAYKRRGIEPVRHDLHLAPQE
ncbi:MAG: DNA polymerase III subunit chi [Hydrogenophaga sp.]|jgi:DNA polymerase-3 subunit chi|uniref:DNA polymerase III subunit chi n=1 Tax=Hydrogenophaga sp. TaxID=1904254 RepID=UPI00275B4DD6|nr:DNA polymerase III subunit chi [Hydrogenophaga sp.]MDP2416568.1 DNA polymerase III subunit chi [Hydrogenophaga sp.]MDZ4187398.1 DNA polymerase III subunit chi [Hydrogenophaga sp.]